MPCAGEGGGDKTPCRDNLLIRVLSSPPKVPPHGQQAATVRPGLKLPGAFFPAPHIFLKIYFPSLPFRTAFPQ